MRRVILSTEKLFPAQLLINFQFLKLKTLRPPSLGGLGIITRRKPEFSSGYCIPKWLCKWFIMYLVEQYPPDNRRYESSWRCTYHSTTPFQTWADLHKAWQEVLHPPPHHPHTLVGACEWYSWSPERRDTHSVPSLRGCNWGSYTRPHGEQTEGEKNYIIRIQWHK